jgi:transcriptional regulator NrdR family protein
MHCRYCKSKNTRVTCTKHGVNETRRYCRCLDCGKRYITLEKYLLPVSEVQRRPCQYIRGEESGFAVLTEKNVRDIHRMAKNTRYVDIAKKYGIHRVTVYRIVHFKRWSHLKNDPTLTQ